MSTQTITCPGQWAMLSAESSDGHAVFRVRTDRPESETGKHQKAIVIRWEYDGDSLGMPDEVTRQLMDDYEDCLDNVSDQDDLSFLMLVTTGFHQREWVYYARETDAFMKRFNESLNGQPRFPLQIGFADDPQWTYWADVQRQCGG